MNETEALLSQLRTIQPPDVGLMPAAGWWLVLALVTGLAALVFYAYKRYQRRGWQREAKTTLDELRKNVDRQSMAQSLSATSRLVRRVVLAVRSRKTVAALQGEAWLDELDEICGKPLFKSGFGKLLEQAPYQPDPQLTSEDLHALLDVVAELIDAAGKQTVGRSSP